MKTVIDQMLVKAGAYFGGEGVIYADFDPKKFAELVRADEREVCAKLAAEPQFWPLPSFTHQPSDRTIGRVEGEKEMSRRIAAAIRARGETK